MNLSELSLSVQKGNAKMARMLVLQALEEHIEPTKILHEGLIDAMVKEGIKFKNNEIYVPEMLVASRAMSVALKALYPIISQHGKKIIGKVVIGTVKGDIHDIGKNLVKMMMEGKGIEVIDLGVNVQDFEFVKSSEETGADIVCLSSLLTTTMPAMFDVITAFKKAGIKDKYAFMIGGAPITTNFAKQINADYYTPDADSAAKLAKNILIKKRKYEMSY
ncbi:cobalamin B12-binding domain-containing protein [Clostridium luticellarii]|uniref:Methionine synthase n=1 Tax=Clostridium luticellarii TaxID=1691940 RepID=A0A2T0BLT0_9CLOT|nr:corrinoid protein [Clostridium luticellarii]MCI1944952.1 corrinoid protein [Clostridium luticellarii]MCI1967898.1 corrinoid protein [Clostridium luticellarii]MCI1996629.1 corrinoid protein [Clostridium luticellarii]MCI2040839.1 corrinoid protein [Clostridium luticellarii]PRR84845.1 Methionine synthase [Clostridium luticellarii]